MGSTKLQDWRIKRVKLQSCSLDGWCFFFFEDNYVQKIVGVCSHFFCKDGSCSQQVTQKWMLHWGCLGSPYVWGWWRWLQPTKPHQGRWVQAVAQLSGGALKSTLAEQNRVLSGEVGCWLGMAAGTAVECADSHPPTMSAMHTAAAWLHYKGASSASTWAVCDIGGCRLRWGYIFQVLFLRHYKHRHAFIASRAFRWMIW